MGPISLGSIANPTLVEVRVEGLLDMTYSQADIWYDSIAGIDRRGQSAGQWDAAGHFLWTYFRCWGNVRVIIGAGGKTFCDGGNAALKSVWADTLIASGAVSAIWLKGPLTQTSQCDAPGKPTCYTFTGSHAVTVTSADAELLLVPSRYVVYPGKASVTFTGSALPSMWGRHSMPFNTQRWTWTPDSAGTPTQHCANQASCTITPQTSGTMTLTALVNGAEKSRSVHIRVLCAPTGDSLMDSLPILDALGAAWDSSNADDPNAANRRERYFTVECNASGECGWTVYPNGPFDTPCEATPPTRDTTGTRTAGGHIHPFTPFTGSPLPPSEIFPPNCGRGPGRGGGTAPKSF